MQLQKSPGSTHLSISWLLRRSLLYLKSECLVEADTNNLLFVLQSMFLQTGGSYRGESRSRANRLSSCPDLCHLLCYKWPYNESKNAAPSTPSMSPFKLPTTLDYFRKTPSGISSQRFCCHSQIQPPLPHSQSPSASLSGLLQVRRTGRQQLSR